MKESREKSENTEDMKLRDDHEFGWVEVIPMTELVGWSRKSRSISRSDTVVKLLTKDCLNFFRLALLDESIENDDVFAL